jgi:hypothetical protein
LEPETTNIWVIDPITHPGPPPPRTRARLRAFYHRPTPFLQRTTTAHTPLCNAPIAITASNTVPSPPSHLLPCVTYHRHSAPEHHCSPIKLPHQLPQLPPRSKQSTRLIKSPLPNRKQIHFPPIAPKITMLGDSWVEDCCTWFIVFGFLICMMVILFDRILQWEEQRERKG